MTTTMSGSAVREQLMGVGVLALDLDHAHPAGAEAGQFRLVAQRWHLDAVLAAYLEDGLADPAGQRPAGDVWIERRGDLGRWGLWVVNNRSAIASIGSARRAGRVSVIERKAPSGI